MCALGIPSEFHGNDVSPYIICRDVLDVLVECLECLLQNGLIVAEGVLRQALGGLRDKELLHQLKVIGLVFNQCG